MQTSLRSSFAGDSPDHQLSKPRRAKTVAGGCWQASNAGRTPGPVLPEALECRRLLSAAMPPAAQLAFGPLPAMATDSGAVSPAVTVSVEDASGSVVAADNSTVTLAIASGPLGARLGEPNGAMGVEFGGSVPATAVNGVATFGNLLFTPGGIYTLTATDGTLSTTSAPFNVAAAMPLSALVPTFGKVSLPTATIAGAKLSAKASVLITNTGPALKGDVTVNLTAFSNISGVDGLTAVASLVKHVSLKAGKGETFNFAIKSLPSTLAAGSYNLLADVVDPGGDSNATLTTQTIQVIAAVIQPRVVVGVVTPASIASGKSGSLEIAISDDGNVAAGGVDITLSPYTDGATPVAGVILDTTHSSAKIFPGHTKGFRLHFKVPTTLAKGSYLLHVAISFGNVAETWVGNTPFTVD